MTLPLQPRREKWKTDWPLENLEAELKFRTEQRDQVPSLEINLEHFESIFQVVLAHSMSLHSYSPIIRSWHCVQMRAIMDELEPKWREFNASLPHLSTVAGLVPTAHLNQDLYQIDTGRPKISFMLK